MARLTRLHWWTVEYGLVGTLDSPKIYGAGILSSIGEASTCLSDAVKKIQYDFSTQDYAFDITTKQPHLFVVDNFKTLISVLEKFAEQMAVRVGGLQGIQQAIETDNTATLVYSSGLQVSGVCTEVLTDSSNNPIFLKTTGKTNLAVDNKELDGHSIEYHKDGFSSPIGNLQNSTKPFEEFTIEDLAKFNISVNNEVSLTFASGIVVNGICTEIKYNNDKLVLLTFKECKVTYNDTVLFDPSWGTYDMAVGSTICSVFSGAADKNAFEQPTAISKTRVIKVNYSDADKALHLLYQKVRDIRSHENSDIDIAEIWQELQKNHAYDWLLAVELLEIILDKKVNRELESAVRSFLQTKTDSNKSL